MKEGNAAVLLPTEDEHIDVDDMNSSIARSMLAAMSRRTRSLLGFTFTTKEREDIARKTSFHVVEKVDGYT